MKIAVFGSCVSRDTAEYIPEAEVEIYIARHSLVNLVTPHGTQGVCTDLLQSSFQRRMLEGDLAGDGLDRINSKASDLDLLLLDLVDERRGFWRFPDGTTVTNSVEFERSGGIAFAQCEGAHLIQFATDQHFNAWKTGLDRMFKSLTENNLIRRTVFLDIEWAQTVEGMPQPTGDLLSRNARRYRKTVRATRAALRGMLEKRKPVEIWNSLVNVEPTLAETYVDRAKLANRQFARYSQELRSRGVKTVARKSEELRIDPRHKWGPQPFHYCKEAYEDIASEIIGLV